MSAESGKQPVPPVIRPGHGPRPGGGLGGRLARHLRALGIAISLILLFIFFTVAAKLAGRDFCTLGNIQTMASQSVIISLGAIGMTLIIISGGIDLSVGSVIALSMVVSAWTVEAGAPLWLGAIAGIATGALAGCLNGVMITAFRLVPFIATLGMMGIARGLAKLLARNQFINITAEDWFSSWLYMSTLNPHLGEFPPPGTPHVPGWLLLAPAVWVLIVLAAVMALALRSTVFGRHVFAIGSNEDAARLCGVRVPLVKVAIYALAGLFTGLAGVVFLSRQSQGDPTAALGYELDIIAAVVIGGGSLNGGEGSILGSLAGALIMIILRTGLRTLNAPAPLQEILIGAIIIVAVIADQLQHRRAD